MASWQKFTPKTVDVASVMETSDEKPSVTHDTLLEECPVVINTLLLGHLHMLQLPTSFASHTLSSLHDSNPSGVLSARYKAAHGILELDIPYDTSQKAFDNQRAEQFAKDALPHVNASGTFVPKGDDGLVLDHQRLTGMAVSEMHGHYMAATMFEGFKRCFYDEPLLFICDKLLLFYRCSTLVASDFHYTLTRRYFISGCCF
jgi:hypothetical protein